MDLLDTLLAPAFMPHGHCYFWQPSMVWTQVLSNLVIGASYTSISLTLWVLTRRMRGLPFSGAYIAFGLFIVLCGLTHFMDIVTVWRGVYWVDASVRVGTALASAATAVWLIPLLPRVVAFGDIVLAEKHQSRAALELELSRGHELRSALETREREFRELVDNLPDLAWSARADGFIEFYNRRWYEYTGMTPEQMEGWGWKAVHDPAIVDRVTEQWTKSLETGEPFEMEFPLRGADGSYRWFLTRVRPLRRGDGTITRWIGTNTDIDDTRRAQAELLRNVELRDEFITIAGHELRTPTTALALQLELVNRAIARGETLRASTQLERADRQLARLKVLIEELLDVSAISLGHMSYTRVEVDLVEIVRDVIARKEARATVARAPISLVADGPVIGQWDRSRVDQVVTNLLTNAIKFGAGHPIEVHVGHSADGAAELRVRDRGPGIAPGDRERIFGRYERATSHNYGGLGLGLFISLQIVEAHGGTIRVESELGHGSTFIVVLPHTFGANDVG